MKEFSGKQIITFRWWREDLQSIDESETRAVRTTKEIRMKPIPKTMLLGQSWNYTNRDRLAKQLRHFRKLNKVTREHPHSYIVDLRKPEWNEEDGCAFIWLVITKENKDVRR